MSYEEIESYSSHASSMVSRASGNISMLQGLLWEIKVRYQDDPNKDLMEKTRSFIDMTREELSKAAADLDKISEELKQYNP